MEKKPLKTLSVSLKSKSYKIYFGDDILENSNHILEKYIKDKSIIIVYDKILEKHLKFLSDTLSNITNNLVSIGVESGEKSKSLTMYSFLNEKIIEIGVDRKSILVAFGGGVIGDLVGFVASTMLRGIDFIQIPTTLLAQVDSSIGGKTGVNSIHGKNLIGSFHQPLAVLSDVKILNSLSSKELISGYAEIIKHALIKDKIFFKWLANFGEDIIYGNDALRVEAIYKACNIKRRIVQEDELEHGPRALLNLGHTFGHAIESYVNYDGSLLHGEAVSVGIILAYKLALEIRSTSSKEFDVVLNHFKQVGLPTSIKQLTNKINCKNKLWQLMQNDKKFSNGKLSFIIPEKIGQVKIRNDISSEVVLSLLKKEIEND